jgi:glycosyltransferase involved in cell wall biosynthesis
VFGGPTIRGALVVQGTGTRAVTIVANDVGGGVGGMERQLEILIRGLLDRKYRVRLISRTCKMPHHPLLRWVRIRGPGRPFSLAYPWFFAAGTAAVLLCRDGPLHTTGAIIANRVDLSTVHFCHAAFQSSNGGSRARRARLSYRLNDRIARLISRSSEGWCYRERRVSRLVAVSGGVARELADAYPDLRRRIQVIPNGVDSSAFRPDPAAGRKVRRRFGLDDDVPVAIFVGGEWHGKGLRFAVESLANAPDWHLLVVGAGDVEHFHGLATRQETEDRVHFAGRQTNTVPFYSAASAFVFPSVYEAAPLVAYEAAAMGLPILASSVSGIEDLLEEGVNGWFVERDAESIARRLGDLQRDPEQRRRMAAAARESALAYDWERVVDMYVDAYKDLSSQASRDS